MDIKRIRDLAGFKGPKAEPVVNTTVTKNFGGIKIHQEQDFKRIAKSFGGAVSINENTSITVGTVSFKEATLEESVTKMEGFKEAWNEVVLENTITLRDLRDLIDRHNAQYGTNFHLGGTYGYQDLWVKDARGDEHRLESGSTKDCYRAFVSQRFNDKWRPADPVAEAVVEEGKEEADYILYVGPKGSGTLHQQHSDSTSAACRQEFKDSWTNEHDKDGKKIRYSFKVLKVLAGETPPKTLEESLAENLEDEPSIDTVETVNVEVPVVADAVQEDNNNFFLKHSTPAKTPIVGIHDPDDLNDRMGIKQEREKKVVVPADVKKAVSARIAELKAAIAQYDEKGYNDISQKEKAIECLEQIMDNLSSGDVEGLKQAQIFFGTLMSPITDLFPAKIVTFLANADARSGGWLDRLKVAEGVGYSERRGIVRDRDARADMNTELGAVGADDSDPAMFPAEPEDDHDPSDWQSSHEGCYDDGDDGDTPPGFYEKTVQCPVCQLDNAITPAHLKYMRNPMCLDCEVSSQRSGNHFDDA